MSFLCFMVNFSTVLFRGKAFRQLIDGQRKFMRSLPSQYFSVIFHKVTLDAERWMLDAYYYFAASIC